MDNNIDMTPETVIKGLVGLPIWWAVDSVVSKTLVAIVPAPAKIPAKIAFAVGRYAISFVVSETVTDRFVNTNYRMIRDIVTNVKNNLRDKSEEDESE